MDGYIRAVGGAVILAALADMLIPEGSMRRYCRMVCGFMILAALLSPLTGSFKEIQTGEYTIDAEKAEAQARARILVQHKENLENLIEARFPGARAYVEVDSEGNVIRVSAEGIEDEADARKYIEESLGVKGEAVKINENKGTD